ncbi:translation initiation factor IF-2-like [Hordeum vulgare subsp. vulgare]|uniref:translation initiation factor IF-2-like n=1 Tax=Hordeum vulgare subsp. vulgare TaxID=112509 RepID=UPI001D1A58B4|nr:translation initiation factor IF-2-like [Hordeum vulgare subsp. vulgare]
MAAAAVLAGAQSRHAIFREELVRRAYYTADEAHRGHSSQPAATAHNYLRMSIRVATEAAPAGATRLLAARAVSVRAIAAHPAVLLGTLRISAIPSKGDKDNGWSKKKKNLQESPSPPDRIRPTADRAAPRQPPPRLLRSPAPPLHRPAPPSTRPHPPPRLLRSPAPPLHRPAPPSTRTQPRRPSTGAPATTHPSSAGSPTRWRTATPTTPSASFSVDEPSVLHGFNKTTATIPPTSRRFACTRLICPPCSKIEELADPPPRLPGIRFLLPLPGGDLLTRGTDLKIRYWDQARPEQSFCIAGPSAKGIGNDECYDIRSSYGVQVVQESCKPSTPASRLTHKTQLAMVAADSAGCHRDAILALASVNLSSQRLISANRDGAVKVRK